MFRSCSNFTWIIDLIVSFLYNSFKLSDDRCSSTKLNDKFVRKTFQQSNSIYFCGIRTSHFIHSISEKRNIRKVNQISCQTKTSFTQTMVRLEFCVDILRPAIMAKSMITYQRLKICLTFKTYRTCRLNRWYMNEWVGENRWFKTRLYFFQRAHGIFELFRIIGIDISRVIIIIVILKWICIIEICIIAIVIYRRLDECYLLIDEKKINMWTYRLHRYRIHFHSCFLLDEQETV